MDFPPLNQKQSDWELLESIRAAAGWHPGGGKPHRPLRPYLYLGAGPSTTPLHFDLGENLLLQVSGVKRIYMWGPGQWDRLAALPLVHPAVQGSAVEDIWDTTKTKALAPRFSGSQAYGVELRPGDILYIPR